MFAMRSQLNGVERLPLPLHFYCFAVATQVSQTLRQAVPDSPSNPAPPATQGDQRLIFQNIERSPKVYNNARLLEPQKSSTVAYYLRTQVLGHLRVRVSSSQRLLAGSEHFSVDLQGFGLATECT